MIGAEKLMLARFPDSARLEVSPALASELLSAAERLPRYENQDFYSCALQGVGA